MLLSRTKMLLLLLLLLFVVLVCVCVPPKKTYYPSNTPRMRMLRRMASWVRWVTVTTTKQAVVCVGVVKNYPESVAAAAAAFVDSKYYCCDMFDDAPSVVSS